jgi:isochorismate hydrolase
MSIKSIDRSQVGVLLIDAQSYFFDVMAESQEPVLARIEHLLMLAGGLGLPVLATFEHPVDEKGTLPARLARVFPVHGQRLAKHTFDCCREPLIIDAIEKTAIKQLVVAGAETDVCVLQSVIGLLKLRLEIFLLEDCVLTSEPDPRPALERMYRSGAIPCTFKILYYELMAGVGEASKIDHKRSLPSNFMWPEALPPRCRKSATEER